MLGQLFFLKNIVIIPFLFLSILDVATNLSMIEKVLDDSVEDPSITSSGEIDEIPDQSIPTVTVY